MISFVDGIRLLFLERKYLITLGYVISEETRCRYGRRPKNRIVFELRLWRKTLVALMFIPCARATGDVRGRRRPSVAWDDQRWLSSSRGRLHTHRDSTIYVRFIPPYLFKTFCRCCHSSYMCCCLFVYLFSNVVGNGDGGCCNRIVIVTWVDLFSFSCISLLLSCIFSLQLFGKELN